jgi:hypothetical protein
MRARILGIIGTEWKHLRGQELLDKYVAIERNKAYHEGRNALTNFWFGVQRTGVIGQEQVAKNLMNILGNFPEDFKFDFSYGVERVEDGIIRFTKLGEESVKVAGDDIVRKAYFKLEGFYEQH